MNPRWRKVLADMWGNLSRFLLVTLSLTIGLFSFGMIAGGYVTTLEDMNGGFMSINPAEIRVRTEAFGDDLVEQVRRLDGVESAEGEKFLYFQMLSGDNQWKNLIVHVIPDDGRTINQLEMLGGRMPKDREILLDVHRDFHLDIGDSVTIQTSTGLQRDFPIVGLVRDQTIGITGTNFFVAPTQGYITFDSLPWFQQEMLYDELLVTVVPGYTKPQFNQLLDEIGDLVEHSGRNVISIRDLTPNLHPNNGYVSAIAGFLALLGFLSVFLSGFLIFNAMTALFAQQIQYIGIMKAIGAQRKDIIRMYMAFIFVIGVIALLAAVPLATWASAQLGEFLAVRLNYRAGGMRIIPLAAIIQSIIALILPQAAGILPILRASKVSVQEAITTTGIEAAAFGESWIDRQIEKFKQLGRPILISLRNTFRQKGRLVLTLITLSLAGAVFIATFNVRASLETYIDKVSQYLLGDISLEFAQYYRFEEIRSISQSVYGVEDIEPRGNATGQLLDDNGSAAESIEILGAPSDSDLIEPILLAGRWLIPGDHNAIVLNEAFVSQYPEINIGDILTIDLNRRNTDWEVVGFFQFIGSDYFLAYVPLDYLNQVTGRINQAANFQLVAKPELIQDGEIEVLSEQLDRLFRKKGFAIRSTTTSDELQGNATFGLDTLTIFLLIMSGLTALVGSISLTGTMGMNVLERTREIGVMRAIGATDHQVKKLVIVEGVFIGLVSWFFSIILAFPISYLMSYVINISLFGISGEFSYTFEGFILWLGIVIVLSVFASILPANNAAKLTIREVLAYE
jgi:putative ABC transport system permease protein